MYVAKVGLHVLQAASNRQQAPGTGQPSVTTHKQRATRKKNQQPTRKKGRYKSHENETPDPTPKTKPLVQPGPHPRCCVLMLISVTCLLGLPGPMDILDAEQSLRCGWSISVPSPGDLAPLDYHRQASNRRGLAGNRRRLLCNRRQMASLCESSLSSFASLSSHPPPKEEPACLGVPLPAWPCQAGSYPVPLWAHKGPKWHTVSRPDRCTVCIHCPAGSMSNDMQHPRPPCSAVGQSDGAPGQTWPWHLASGAGTRAALSWGRQGRAQGGRSEKGQRFLPTIHRDCPPGGRWGPTDVSGLRLEGQPHS